MWSEEWLGGQSRSGVENGTDGWLRRRDTGRGYWNSNMRRRWSWPGYWREGERRDPGDLCKAELKGLGDCLEWAGGKSQDWGSSSVLGGPSDLSSIIGQNGPRDALCSSLQPLPVATFGISHSVTLSLQGLPTPFSELSSSLPICCELPDSSELLYQDGGHHQPLGQHAFAELPHLPLCGLFWMVTMRLWWARVILPQTIQEEVPSTS